MSQIWAVIVSVILLMVIYSYISSKIKEKKKNKLREKSIPLIEDNISPGNLYNVHISDGRKFLAVEILGSSSSENGQVTFTGWESMFVLKQQSGKRIFLRQTAIRYIEEV